MILFICGGALSVVVGLVLYYSITQSDWFTQLPGEDDDV